MAANTRYFKFNVSASAKVADVLTTDAKLNPKNWVFTADGGRKADVPLLTREDVASCIGYGALTEFYPIARVADNDRIKARLASWSLKVPHFLTNLDAYKRVVSKEHSFY